MLRYLQGRRRLVHPLCIAGFPRRFVETNKGYNAREIEQKWKTTWDTSESERFQIPSESQRSREKRNTTKEYYYVLSMFPYPSGKLHMGHVRVYTISDVIARFQKMQGKTVINPIGWDSFGLPAENAARQNNCSASEWTLQNISDMKQQLEPLGINFQWQRELQTSSPEYYKWTQWIFLQLYKQGLAYQKNSYVNWDPIDKTVLANEQVLVDGTSWRSGAKVEKRAMNQWFFKISQYAERLLHGLEILKETWPSTVLTLQRNWIGKPSHGTIIEFSLHHKESGYILPLSVFTTRVDTIYGASFIGLSPHHQILHEIQNNVSLTSDWMQKLQVLLNHSLVDRFGEHSEEKEIQVIPLNEFYATNPMNNEQIPVFICSYVLEDYGTGAVMGVPAHDDRDAIVAQQFSLPVKTVLKTSEIEDGTTTTTLINSDELNGVEKTRSVPVIISALKEKGREHTMYRIRDWLVSRQRYWGAPIPIIHCESCGTVPVPEHELPVMLPQDSNLHSLDEQPEWYNTKCPSCGQEAKRDTDTMDTFVDSSWYYMRYIDPQNTKEFVNKEKAAEYLPVDIYIGGNEHAILHLLYARFIHKFLKDQEFVNGEEPFHALLTQGMVHGQTFRLADTGKYLQPHEITVEGSNAIYKEDPEKEIQISFEKMSKSKFNGLQPQELIDEFGADTVRLYMLFKAPPSKVLEWDHKGIIGQHRWLVRLWSLVHRYLEQWQSQDSPQPKSTNAKLTKEQNAITKSVSDALTDTYSFNVAIASLMKWSNTLSKEVENQNVVHCQTFLESLQNLLIMLAPMAPFISEELWHQLSTFGPLVSHSSSSVHEQAWPVVKKEEKKQQRHIIIQYHGKTKGKITVPEDIPFEESSLTEFIKKQESFCQTFQRRDIKNVIFLPNSKVINFVFQ